MVLVTGANGFIGSYLVRDLKSRGTNPRRMCQSADADAVLADLNSPASLVAACAGINSIFHCAGFAHAFAARSSEEATRHWQVNYEGTRNLVEAAGEAGVKDFVFLSSVKAMAEPGGVCADENFPGEPTSPYGLAKRAAEQAVLEAGQRFGMHVVNLRLAMVYGRGGRGNLERMGRLVRHGWFPPLPECGNRRSLVHVSDVVAVMRLVVDDPRANGKTYIVTGTEAPSGRQLFDAMRRSLGMSPCGWAVPHSLLRASAIAGDALESVLRRRLPFDSEVLDRLLGSAWYSSAKIEKELGWRAQTSLVDGLAEMFGHETSV